MTKPASNSVRNTFFKDNPSVTPIQLSEAAGISHEAAKKNLQCLLKEGLLCKTGYETYGLTEE